MNINKDIIFHPEQYLDLQIRNPIVDLDTLKIGIIGDVHIGKTFRTGVPKHRLGERESMILGQLTELLNRPVNYTVLVGDLFDKIRVSNNDLLSIINIIEQAVINNPHIKYVIINGNHDMPKETDRTSSFQIFEKYFLKSSYPNLTIVSKHSKTNIIKDQTNGTILYFSHYNPFVSLDDEISSEDFSDIDYSLYPIRIAFGHWETIDFGSDHFIDRVVPTNVLENFNLVITGHEHKPKVTLVDNVPVITSGSMQPYAYGEEMDTEKDFYRTLTLEAFVELLKQDSEYFKNSYVRILTEIGDELPDDFECLGRTYKPRTKKVSQIENKELNKPDGEEPLSFQQSFHNLIKDLSKDNSTHEEFLQYVEKTFLDKSYKENT